MMLLYVRHKSGMGAGGYQPRMCADFCLLLALVVALFVVLCVALLIPVGFAVSGPLADETL